MDILFLTQYYSWADSNITYCIIADIMVKSLLEIDSIQKYFGDKLLLSDIYLRCETGEIIGLLGRNGSGKSTLLKIIFGIIPTENKFVRIDGVVKQSTAQILSDISYLSQHHFIPKYFSVRQAILLSIPKLRQPKFLADEFIRAIISKRVHELSTGELRYLEIKMILQNPSKFALLDEPFNGLAPLMIEKVREMILANSTQKGIIITDHNYENVMKLSHRNILIFDGRTVPINSPQQLVEYGYLSAAKNLNIF